MTSTGRARRYRSTPPRWQGPSRPWGNWFKGGQMGRLSAAVALLVMLGTAAIGWASIPDSAGVIHGCRHRQTGALRAARVNISEADLFGNHCVVAVSSF